MTWRVAVTPGWRFARDEMEIRIANRDPNSDVISMAKVSVTMNDMLTEDEDTPWIIPRELAEALFNALAPYVVGTESKDLATEVFRLRRERDDAMRRFDALLNGIGRCTAIASATGPGGTPPDHLDRSGKVVNHNLPSGNQP